MDVEVEILLFDKDLDAKKLALHKQLNALFKISDMLMPILHRYGPLGCSKVHPYVLVCFRNLETIENLPNWWWGCHLVLGIYQENYTWYGWEDVLKDWSSSVLHIGLFHKKIHLKNTNVLNMVLFFLKKST